MRTPAALVLTLAALACRPAPPVPLGERIDAAVAEGLAFVLDAQSADGAWRSQTYGALKDDWTLTATCVKALAFAPGDARGAQALGRGLAWLASAVRADGTISPGPSGLPYPVYTASLAAIAFARADPSDPERWARERDAWLALLEAHQLTEELGWSPEDAAYGGWSYAPEPPRKGERHSFEADLSSTVFALGALRLAGRPADDASVRRARGFVLRCQNRALEGEQADPSHDDGGFFMSPTVELQNKAGGGWQTPTGRQRFASYGSMTADGLRALLRLGFQPHEGALLEARRWLEVNFDPASNPGEFDELREVERDAAYHYGSWSLAHALVGLDLHRLSSRHGERAWARELAEELLARQRDDGSWSNPYTMMKEDDPLVATPLALGALALCRMSLLAAGD